MQIHINIITKIIKIFYRKQYQKKIKKVNEEYFDNYEECNIFDIHNLCIKSKNKCKTNGYKLYNYRVYCYMIPIMDKINQKVGIIPYNYITWNWLGPILSHQSFQKPIYKYLQYKYCCI